jgi:hypothetical protein
LLEYEHKDGVIVTACWATSHPRTLVIVLFPHSSKSVGITTLNHEAEADGRRVVSKDLRGLKSTGLGQWLWGTSLEAV